MKLSFSEKELTEKDADFEELNREIELSVVGPLELVAESMVMLSNGKYIVDHLHKESTCINVAVGRLKEILEGFAPFLGKDPMDEWRDVVSKIIRAGKEAECLKALREKLEAEPTS